MPGDSPVRDLRQFIRNLTDAERETFFSRCGNLTRYALNAAPGDPEEALNLALDVTIERLHFEGRFKDLAARELARSACPYPDCLNCNPNGDQRA